MKINIFKQKIKSNNSGYAILFTIIIISVMMTFASGIANSVLKQIVLSSTANDSQVAFYQADTAGECALYLALDPNVDFETAALGSTLVQCGVTPGDQQINLKVSIISKDNYLLEQFTPTPLPEEPCSLIKINESNVPQTVIKAYGYNVCDINNPRRVERGIQIEF